MEFVKSESTVKPVQIDENSSASGVYIRICIEEKQVEDSIKYEYLEAFITKNEWEQYKLIAKIQGATIDAPTIEYAYKMNTPVIYPKTGFLYLPSWAEGVYKSLIEDGKTHPEKFPLPIFDVTHKEERMVKMSLEELTALSSFLYDYKEQYFTEKQKHQAENN